MKQIYLIIILIVFLISCLDLIDSCNMLDRVISSGSAVNYINKTFNLKK